MIYKKLFFASVYTQKSFESRDDCARSNETTTVGIESIKRQRRMGKDALAKLQEPIQRSKLRKRIYMVDSTEFQTHLPSKKSSWQIYW